MCQIEALSDTGLLSGINYLMDFYVFKFRLLFKLAMRTHLFFTSCEIRVFFSLTVNTKKIISPCHKQHSLDTGMS